MSWAHWQLLETKGKRLRLQDEGHFLWLQAYDSTCPLGLVFLSCSPQPLQPPTSLCPSQTSPLGPDETHVLHQLAQGSHLPTPGGSLVIALVCVTSFPE